MFKERYREANDSVHVGDALLTRIQDAQTQPGGKTIRWILAGGGALASAAVVILAVVLLGGTNASFRQARSDETAMSAELEMSAEANDADAGSDTAAAASGAEAPQEEALCESSLCDTGEACGETGCGSGYASDIYGQSHMKGHTGSASLHDGAAYLLSTDGLSVQIVSASDPDAPSETLTLGGYADSLLVSDTLLLACGPDDSASSYRTVLMAYSMRDRALLWQYSAEGTLLDAFCGQDTLYLLLSTENGLRVTAMNGSDPNDWSVSYDAGAYWGGASLWPADDGALLAYQTASGSSNLLLLMNEPDGLSPDAEAVLEFNVMYACETASGWCVFTKDTDGVLAVSRLNSLLERVGEQVAVGAGLLIADDARVLILSYRADDNWSFIDGVITESGYDVSPAQDAAQIDGSYDPVCLDAASDSLLLQHGTEYYLASASNGAAVPILIAY